MTPFAQPALRVRRSVRAIGLMPVMLVAMTACIAFAEPRFLNASNLTNVVRNGALLALVACGQSLVLIVGGFDLSVGAVMALSSVVTVMATVGAHAAMPDAPGLALSFGAVAGLLGAMGVGVVNGLSVAIFRLPGFIVTLGMMSIVGGVVLLLTQGAPIYGLPAGFVDDFGRARWGGLPAIAYCAAALVLALLFLQRRTIVGRHMYAIGGNPNAARNSGVQAAGYILCAYVLSAMMAGAAAILLTAQIGSGQASLGGDRFMLQSIAAAVIGGVSLRGGVGRISQVALGAFFLTVLTNALNLLRIDSKVQLIVVGFILVAAVAIDALSKERRPA